MPFARAVTMLGRLTGVQISEATAQRHSYQIGAVQEVLQQVAPVPADQFSIPAAKEIISVDGAMVPLLKGKWAEVKTVVVGEIEAGKPGETAHSYHLSYFSRMQEATTFTEQASAELLRRGVDRAKQVCAVMDGAEWIDGFVDGQRPDALRILDFAHAAEYVSEIGQLAQGAGIPLTDNWLQTQLHTLKHDGPAAVLRELERLRDLHPRCLKTSGKSWHICKSEKLACSIPTIKHKAGRLVRGSWRVATKS